MSDESPSLEEVANALPARPIHARELFRLVLAKPEHLLFIPSSTAHVEGGVRIATVAVQHVPTGHRYLVGWSAEDGRWIGIDDWPPGEFEAFDLEYNIDGWHEQAYSG